MSEKRLQKKISGVVAGQHANAVLDTVADLETGMKVAALAVALAGVSVSAGLVIEDIAKLLVAVEKLVTANKTPTLVV